MGTRVEECSRISGLFITHIFINMLMFYCISSIWAYTYDTFNGDEEESITLSKAERKN